MNAASEDIKDILVANSSLALEFGTDLFIAREPAEKTYQDCVTIFDTSTQQPQLTLAGQGEDYDYTSIQIRVRNKNYVAGWALIQNIKTALHGLGQVTQGGTLYSLVYCSSGPALMDWDENNRARFIINFNIQRR